MPRTLLFVDDDPDIRMIAGLAIQREGRWRVVSCASGEEALELARTVCADAVLLDVMMPGLDGVATLLKLREISHYADVPVLFLTARSHHLEHERLLQLGAAGVLTKPFDPVELPRRLDALIEAKGP